MGYLPRPQTASRVVSSTYTTGLAPLLTGAAINTKGGWVDIYTPTETFIGFVIIELQPAGIAGGQALVDVARGIAGQENIFIANLAVNAGTDFHVHSVAIPVAIPAGDTIQARYQRSNASLTMRCGIKLFSAMDRPHGSVISTLGATTATSRGTAVDPGAVLNTKGAYSQLVAATTAPINWLMLHIGNQGNITRTDAMYVVDVAIGAAAAETVIVPNLGFSISDTADEPVPSYIGPFPISIPIGSRVAVRAACTITDAADRLFDVIAYGGA